MITIHCTNFLYADMILLKIQYSKINVMFVCIKIKGRRDVPDSLCISVLLCAFISLHLVDATQSMARLSGRLSQAICRSTAEYSASHKIQAPLDDASKFSTRSKSSCEVVGWTKYCEPEGTCKKFDCSSLSSPPQVKTRIVGGKNAFPHEFPHQVYFKSPFPFCGGTILNKKYLITAAHCFDKQDASNYGVVAGAHSIRNKSGKEQERKLKRVIIHEDYEPGPEVNDITLVEVDPPFALGDEVQPVLLPEPNYVAKGNAFVTGWGKLREGGSYPDILQKVSVPIITNKECADAYEGEEEITSTILCAGYLGVGGKDSCQGDSGGPLAIKMANGSFLLVGIVSWGYKCADVKNPGVYTEVSKFLDWIRKNAT